MGLIDNLLAAFRGVGQDYKRLAAKVDALPAVEQDTGWRDFKRVLRGWSNMAFGAGDLLLFRRQGRFVHVLLQLEMENTTGYYEMQSPIPLGFRPVRQFGYELRGSPGGSYNWPIVIEGSGAVYKNGWQQASGHTQIVQTYITNDPFPDVIPGAPWPQ